MTKKYENTFFLKVSTKMNKYLKDNLLIGIILILLFVVTLFLFIRSGVKLNDLKFSYFWDLDFLIYTMVGLLAQIVDGSLGMAYGATTSSILLSQGVSPLAVSTGVHFAEVFTTGASGISHLKIKNVNKKLFVALLLPGIVGALIGAYLLADIIDGNQFRPYVSVYVFILGFIFLLKSLRKKKIKKKTKNISLLAFIGGFLDSVGAGGWGPVVTSSLLAQGRSIVYTVGSVNLAEFFVAFSASFIFMFFNSQYEWKVILGLILGGVFASPFAAYLVKKVQKQFLMLLVAILILVISSFNIWKYWFK